MFIVCYTGVMFDKYFGNNRPVVKAEVRSFLSWFSALDKREVREQVRAIMARAEEVVPGLTAWRITPQSGPWHCEGPHLADHIERILVGVMSDGALLEIEEFAGEKDLALEIAALETTIHKYRDFLTVFALTHDAAKPATLAFDAPEKSRGAAEGFIVRNKDLLSTATDAERIRYDKLYRAYEAAHHGQNIVANMAGFYDAYEITAHYRDHASVGATLAFTADRQEILAANGVPLANAKLLTELIRYHIEVIDSFSEQPDVKKYELMTARAGKAGLNVDVFLDLMLAVAYLDAIVGCVVLDGGKMTAQTKLIINILRAEREVLPKRHEERVRKLESVKKQVYKDALDKAGISGEAVFKLLQTPFGPERGVLMEQVWLAIKDKSHRLEVGEHSAELARRIELAREILASYNAAV
jgi:hypothetical protein